MHIVTSCSGIEIQRSKIVSSFLCLSSARFSDVPVFPYQSIHQSTNTTSRWLSRTTMIPRQPLALQHRSSLHPMIHPRCSIVAAVVVVMIQTLWIITAKSTFTAAFHIQDGSRHRIPIGRTTMNREDTSWTIAWLMDRRPAPKSIVNRVRFGYSLLEMVKNRVGLEQKRESATPTGANDEFVIRMG